MEILKESQPPEMANPGDFCYHPLFHVKDLELSTSAVARGAMKRESRPQGSLQEMTSGHWPRIASKGLGVAQRYNTYLDSPGNELGVCLSRRGLA